MTAQGSDRSSDERTQSGLSRRTLLALGGATAVVTTLDWAAPAYAGTQTTLDATASDASGRALTDRVRPFDEGWRFFRGEATSAEATAFDDAGWREVTTPHDWSIEDLPDPTAADGGTTADPAVFDLPTNAPARIGPFDAAATTSGSSQAWTVGGEGWYRKHFRVDLGADDLAEIRFDGVYEFSDVWLNGQHLGFQAYGYAPITYDLTPYLDRDGENVLAVRVRNIGSTSRWYSGSGIFRNVQLAVTSPVRIPRYGVRVSSHDVTAKSALVSVVTSVLNARDVDGAARVRVTLLDHRGRRVDRRTTVPMTITPDGPAEFRIDFPVNRPYLWSTSEPFLYQAVVEVIVDDTVVDADSTTFGVRSIVMNGSVGLLVNGEPVKLRGANVHADNGGLGGAAHAQADYRKLKLIKEAGHNAVRTAHNPYSTHFYDACDELGLLVIAEFFDGWSIHKRADDYATYFEQTWRDVVTRVVQRDANHPSILMWSTGNEINIRARPALQDVWGKPLADLAREVDPTRPVTQGSAMGHALGLRIPDDSPEWDYLDVASVQYLIEFSEMHAAHPDKPFYIGETWTSRMYDFHQSVTASTWIIGEFSWTGMDYLGEAGVGAIKAVPVGTPPGGIGSWGYPMVISYCGDLDLIGQPKPQLAYRHVVWGTSQLEVAVERPVPEGLAQTLGLWSWYDELPSWTWDVPAGTLMTVRVYTPGDRAVLELDGRKIAERQLTEADERIATFQVPYRPGVLTATAFSGARRLAGKSLRTVTAPHSFALTLEERRFPKAAGSLAHVLVEVVDRAGRLVPDAVVEASLTIRGDAELLAVSSANPHYVDSFQQPRRHTYHGKALVILRSTAENARGSLTVASPGLVTRTRAV